MRIKQIFSWLRIDRKSVYSSISATGQVHFIIWRPGNILETRQRETLSLERPLESELGFVLVDHWHE